MICVNLNRYSPDRINFDSINPFISLVYLYKTHSTVQTNLCLHFYTSINTFIT